MKPTALFFLCLFFLAPVAFSQQKDKPGCNDHPLFSRMPGYWIRNCDEKEFTTHAFSIGPGKTTHMEGRYWEIQYFPLATLKPMPGDIQILRNFENAALKLGGKLVAKEKGKETLSLVQNGKEVWVEVWAEFTGKYNLTLVEKSEMQQDIVANAAAFANDLKATGHSAL
jgi:OOP family OmpA-OmpF porin